MPEWLADLLLRVKLPFSVNILAEQAGLAALDDDIFVSQTLLVVSEGRRDAGTRELTAMGCKVSAVTGEFSDVRTTHGRANPF